MSDIDNQFNEAYQRSKQAHSAPPGIKRQVLEAADQKTKSYLPFWFNREWAAIGAACFVLAITVGIFDFKNTVTSQGLPEATEVALEMHAYEEEGIAFTAAHYREQLTAYEKDHQHRLSHQNIAATRVVILEQMDEGWIMSDCRDNHVAISKRLLADMKANSRIAPGLDVGDQVELALNREGFILHISNSTASMQC